MFFSACVNILYVNYLILILQSELSVAWNGVTIEEPFSDNGWGLRQWFSSNNVTACSDCVSKLSESDMVNLVKNVNWSGVMNGSRITDRVSFIRLCVLLLLLAFTASSPCNLTCGVP